MNKFSRLQRILLLTTLWLVFPVVPAYSQTVEPPVVHAVMFWMSGCSHCETVRANTLPPLRDEYGSAFDLLQVEVSTSADVDLLYAMADRLGAPQAGVPFLIIGDHVLVGSEQIPKELPGLIETYLEAGGVSLPVIPELEQFSSMSIPVSPLADAVVRVIVFSTLECSSCELTIRQALAPLQETYPAKLEFRTVDVVTGQDVDYLYQVAAQFGIPEEFVDLPLVIIGDHILMDEEIAADLPALIEEYLAKGGVEFPSLPPRLDATATPAPAPSPAETEAGAPSAVRSDGFALAIGIMVLMAAALTYSLIAFALGKTFSLPFWADWLIPALIAIGIGVAAYLSYVETQMVAAACGPIGDCNTVQQSRYATLFGFLPMGVLGLLGYLGMLAAWLTRKVLPKFAKPADLAFFGMAVFAVIFSIYLTYLEPFVIRAVCIWCLSSAVIVTLLLLLGTPPAVGQFAITSEDEPYANET